MIVVLVLILTAEWITWSVDSEIKLMKVDKTGGILNYISVIVRSFILPEITTVLLLTLLMYWVRRWLGIKSVDLTWLAIGRYELLFLPVLLIAFVLIMPFTQSVRYLLENFPNYSFASYWNLYILYTFSWHVYLTYLFPILFVGYTTLNLSLLLDYVKPAKSPLLK